MTQDNTGDDQEMREMMRCADVLAAALREPAKEFPTLLHLACSVMAASGGTDNLIAEALE